ncbi:MAG: hypothetical protein ACXU81_04065 [Myxococcaceae bacterium]
MLSSRCWLAFAAILLGVALWCGDGTVFSYANGSLSWTAVAALVLAWGAMIAAFSVGGADSPELLGRILGGGIFLQFVLLLARPPGRHLLPDLSDHFFVEPIFSMACMAMAMLAASFVVGRPLLGRWTFLSIVGLFAVASVWMLWASPAPPIDVIQFHREAARALAEGRTPYDLHFPNLYGHTRFYGPGFATPSSIDVGAPYPPLSVLATSLATYLVGDPRAAFVAASVAAALLIERLDGPAARLASVLYMTSPRRFLVLELSWTEPLMTAFFAATLVLAVRHSRWLFLGLAGLLGSKQFSVLLVPLTPFLVGEARPGPRTLRLLARALPVLALTLIPFVLWDAHAFFRSTVGVLLAVPFRPDSLNFAALWAWAHHGAVPPTTLPTLACVVAATLVALLRCRPTPGGFAAGGALVMLGLLAWSRQAHLNYYDLVIGLLACALACPPAWGVEARPGRTVG